MGSKHIVIPDTQVKQGVPLDHLRWAGEYIVAKKPDTVVMIGDFADMESLGQYDVGKKSFEGRRYKLDIQAAHAGMELLLRPLWEYNANAKKNHEKRYNPRLVLTLGNHEDRIDRCVEADAKLEGMLSQKDLGYEDFGWEVVPFLEPVVIDGIAYCHYFTSGVMGKPVTSAAALLSKKHQSCVMGHVQGRQIAYGTRADGKQLTGLFVGGYYQHDEAYLKWQGNKHWRGLWVLHEVEDGQFDEMPVSMNYLKRKYGNHKTV
jgi:hypothetical protein